jgi:hypothetical protein
VLVAGTKTVTPGVAFSDQAKIFVCASLFGGTSGKLSAPVANVDPVAGTFVINSDQAADTSTVSWLIIDENLQFSASGHRIGQSKGAIEGTTTFTEMNPLVDSEVFAAASVIDVTGTPGNLLASLNLNDGSVNVESSGADNSLVEVLAL